MLGKHKVGKSYLKLNKFEDSDIATLKKLIMKAYINPVV